MMRSCFPIISWYIGRDLEVLLMRVWSTSSDMSTFMSPRIIMSFEMAFAFWICAITLFILSIVLSYTSRLIPLSVPCCNHDHFVCKSHFKPHTYGGWVFDVCYSLYIHNLVFTSTAIHDVFDSGIGFQWI